MDIKNARAVKTLIRNRLLNNKWEETHHWFHEKGVTIDIYGDYYFLNADRRGHISELSDFCNSVVYKNSELVCYHGMNAQKSTLEELKNNQRFIWNDKTIFIEYLNGKSIYMFWDKFANKWAFSDDKKTNPPFRNIVEKSIYNIMSLDTVYTYCFKVVESGKNSGIFLETMYNNESCKELNWEEVYKTSLRTQLKHPDVYLFEGFDKLEEGDFPVFVKDISKNMFLLEKIK